MFPLSWDTIPVTFRAHHQNGFPLGFLTEHRLCSGNRGCPQTCIQVGRTRQAREEIFGEHGRNKTKTGGADQTKPKPSAIPWSLRVVHLRASLGVYRVQAAPRPQYT